MQTEIADTHIQQLILRPTRPVASFLSHCVFIIYPGGHGPSIRKNGVDEQILMNELLAVPALP